MMSFTLACNESGDWYVIPVYKVEEWDTKWSLADDEPVWATYIQDPTRISFDEYEVEK